MFASDLAATIDGMSFKLLPVVKAYPVIDPVSQTEAVCVAGISMEQPHRWVRLFPLDYRGLQRASQFKKYEVIELEASKSSKDSRPESFSPVLDSIEVGESISTDNGTWRRRLPYFDAVEDESMCEIQRRQKTERKTLGVFRPAEVMDFTVGPAEKGFAESQRALLNQPSLFGDRALVVAESPWTRGFPQWAIPVRFAGHACKSAHSQAARWRNESPVRTATGV
jgi:hypothetical protein